jgi:DNA-binding transcriptional LysR family regulator
MSADLDLNLLKIFDALIEEGSVTGAAARLHLSVPATSRALGRLRRAVGDPVFVRAGRGLAPTPFAVRTAPQIRALLDGAHALLSADRAIEPATLERSFTIRINDGITATLAPILAARIAHTAPGVTLRFIPEGDEDLQPLRNGTVDLDIGAHSATATDVRSRPLYTEHLVGVVAARTHFARNGTPTLAELAAQLHVSASRRGRAHGPLDLELERHDLRRRVVAVVPTFDSAAMLASHSSLVGLVPARLAQACGPTLLLRTFTIPCTLPPVEISCQWHTRLDSDQAHRWLQDLVIAAAQETDHHNSL